MTLQLTGVRHVSALSAHLERTHDFYTRFELATDGPGSAVDGPLDGERLSLPSFLQERRAEIEAMLKPLPSVHASGQAPGRNLWT